MIKAKGPLLGFGKWRIKELLCDACQSRIDENSEYFGKLNFFEDSPPDHQCTHCHVECASKMSPEQLLANHSRSFRNGFSLPEWESYETPSRKGEEFRALFEFVQDTSGLLRKINHCNDCGSIAVISLVPDVSDPTPKLEYYHIGSQVVHSTPSACVTSLNRVPTGLEIVKQMDCSHDFVRLFRSGAPHINLTAIYAKTKSEIMKMDKADRDFLSMFGMETSDIYLSASEVATGYTWYWCQRCGYVARIMNDSNRQPPIHGFSSPSDSGRYRSSGVFQSRFAGASVCKVEG